MIGLGRHPINKISTSPIFVSKRNATRHSYVKDVFVACTLKGNDIWLSAMAKLNDKKAIQTEYRSAYLPIIIKKIKSWHQKTLTD